MLTLRPKVFTTLSVAVLILLGSKANCKQAQSPSGEKTTRITDVRSPLVSEIVNGYPSPDRPFYVQLYSLDVETIPGVPHVCGGAIIGTHWIITTATCTEIPREVLRIQHEFRTDRNLTIHAGPIEHIFRHPYYESDATTHSVLYNVALIKLERSLPAHRVLPLCDSREPIFCTTLGFCGLGSIHPFLQVYPSRLQEILMTEQTFGFSFTTDHEFIHARRATEGMHTLCHGDIGGPLYTFHANTRRPRCLYGVAIRFRIDPDAIKCEKRANFASVPFFFEWIHTTMDLNGGP